MGLLDSHGKFAPLMRFPHLLLNCLNSKQVRLLIRVSEGLKFFASLQNPESKCHISCLLIVGCSSNQVFYCSRLTSPFHTVSQVPLRLDTPIPALHCAVCPVKCSVSSVSSVSCVFSVHPSTNFPAFCLITPPG